MALRVRGQPLDDSRGCRMARGVLGTADRRPELGRHGVRLEHDRQPHTPAAVPVANALRVRRIDIAAKEWGAGMRGHGWVLQVSCGTQYKTLRQAAASSPSRGR